MALYLVNMNAPSDPSTVIIRKPPAVLWSSMLYPLLSLAVALFVPRFRIFGVLFFSFTIVRFATQTLSVRITESEVILQSLVGRRRYPLRHIRHIEFADAPATFGATTPSVRLDFFEGAPVRISGFLIDGTDALYKAILTAWQRIQST